MGSPGGASEPVLPGGSILIEFGSSSSPGLVPTGAADSTGVCGGGVTCAAEAGTPGTTREDFPSSIEPAGSAAPEGSRSPDPPDDGVLTIDPPFDGAGRVVLVRLGEAAGACEGPESQHIDDEADVVTRPVLTRYEVGSTLEVAR